MSAIVFPLNITRTRFGLGSKLTPWSDAMQSLDGAYGNPEQLRSTFRGFMTAVRRIPGDVPVMFSA